MTETPRRPTAFRLDEVELVTDPDAAPRRPAGRPVVLAEPPSAEALPAPVRPRRPFRFAGLLGAAASGLVALGLGLAIDTLVRDLFARTEWLGWLGLAFTALFVFALLAILVRELAGLLRLSRIGDLRDAAEAAAATDDRSAARTVLKSLVPLYADRPETARARKALAGHMDEIIDGRDLIGLGERELLAPLDAAARAMVLSAAKRVTLVTAISPRAVVDLMFVLVTILGLVRRLGRLYGGRPGTLGFLRLARAVLGHLAVTGGMAAGDSIVQQIVGHGVAARLSARLGEGVVNGILTARVGIAAIEVCRPLPFIAGRPPALSDVMAELMKLGARRPDGPPPEA
ncbi:YcjF family protein [Prosthecomicrobium pneumaticum]|uniref:Putative membrane protein n=1 Tax=Prosthecomicrobium pneumaticum TaxID=81895 RepID=A0A7W9L3Z5_9HYPH|nr:TIGR01620 family protein [Prosthecomicrobium pneumaticum]MBB5755062.1 putative membrane protein [Prosthecomicrobium pneumaticum]